MSHGSTPIPLDQAHMFLRRQENGLLPEVKVQLLQSLSMLIQNIRRWETVKGDDQLLRTIHIGMNILGGLMK